LKSGSQAFTLIKRASE